MDFLIQQIPLGTMDSYSVLWLSYPRYLPTVGSELTMGTFPNWWTNVKAHNSKSSRTEVQVDADCDWTDE